jgi:enoyl-CoA hydratase/carnithine racemase
MESLQGPRHASAGRAMSITIKVNVPSGTIVLDRPDKRNALSRQMIEALMQAFDDLHQDGRCGR